MSVDYPLLMKRGIWFRDNSSLVSYTNLAHYDKLHVLLHVLLLQHIPLRYITNQYITTIWRGDWDHGFWARLW